MAQKVIYTDDLDGTEGASPFEYSVEGKGYVIDLSEKNREKLLAFLAPYIAKSVDITHITTPTKPSAKKKKKTRPGSDRPVSTLAEIRAWARANGYEVSDRGRVPYAVAVAYDAAQK